MPDVRSGHDGYLAVPRGSAGPWPGVVVIHEAFGLNADTRAKADQLAGRGYLALAPDLFDGKLWLRCVGSMFRQVRAGSVRVRGAGRVPGLAGGGPDCTGRTGVIGFCMGGGSRCCARRAGSTPWRR